ncbi:MAG: preprotein translocase subunit YajC [Phycisphaeraceae bacterium]
MFDAMYLTLAQQDPAPPPPPAENGANGATTGEPGAPTPTDPAPQQPEPNMWSMFIPLILLLVVFYFLLIMPQRRDKKRKEQMMATMKKGDRVQTIGGILGTVVELREHEVVVKVDESNNTRLHFAKAAVQAVVDKDKDKDNGKS